MRFKAWIYTITAVTFTGLFGLIYMAEKKLDQPQSTELKLAGGSATGNAIESGEEKFSEKPVENPKELQAYPNSSSSEEPVSSSLNDSLIIAPLSSNTILLKKKCNDSELNQSRLLCGSPLEFQTDTPLAGLRIEINQGLFSTKELVKVRDLGPFEITVAPKSSEATSGLGVAGPIEWVNFTQSSEPLNRTWTSEKESLDLADCRLLPAQNDETFLASKILFQDQGQLIMVRSLDETPDALLFHCPNSLGPKD